MTEVEKEKLRQVISRTDKSGNEKVDMLIELMEAYAAQQSKMPTDAESEKASLDFVLRIFDDRTQKVRMVDVMWGWQKCIEWLRNQIG